MERKRSGTTRNGRVTKIRSPNKKLNQPQNTANDDKLSRFTVKSLDYSFGKRTIPTATETTSKKATQKKSKLDLIDEKRLFNEKPELFEKRMIIIDGSNVAYS